MVSERIAVVHLVRKANDIRFLHAFLDAYRALPPGLPHELILILKGFGPGEDAVVQDATRDIEWSPLVLPDAGRDVGSYLAAAGILQHDLLLFVNSFSRPLHADWLAKLHAALEREPDAGIVGATGSWWRMSRGDPFPNYNIRTNGFLVRRDVLTGLKLWEIRDRHDAVLFEAGPEGLTAQLFARGLRPYVVDAEGVAWPHERWPISRTFWSREQEGLLIADNRTDAYAAAGPRLRAWYRKVAWSEEKAGRRPGRPPKWMRRIGSSLGLPDRLFR